MSLVPAAAVSAGSYQHDGPHYNTKKMSYKSSYEASHKKHDFRDCEERFYHEYYRHKGAHTQWLKEYCDEYCEAYREDGGQHKQHWFMQHRSEVCAVDTKRHHKPAGHEHKTQYVKYPPHHYAKPHAKPQHKTYRQAGAKKSYAKHYSKTVTYQRYDHEQDHTTYQKDYGKDTSYDRKYRVEPEHDSYDSYEQRKTPVRYSKRYDANKHSAGTYHGSSSYHITAVNHLTGPDSVNVNSVSIGTKSSYGNKQYDYAY